MEKTGETLEPTLDGNQAEGATILKMDPKAEQVDMKPIVGQKVADITDKTKEDEQAVLKEIEQALAA